MKRLLVIAAALAILLPALPAEAADSAVWNVHCALSHTGADDPIVYPNQPGKSHMHSFYGNTTTDAASTTSSLLAAPSSCTRGLEGTDHSAYWVPSVYSKGAGGTMTLDTGKPGDQSVTVYYRRPGGATGPKVQAFPAGFRMIAGDHNATGPQPASVSHWNCQKNAGFGAVSTSSNIAACPAGQHAGAVVRFPSCWNGKNIDSSNHMSHVAYPGKKGVCPAGYPVSLPAVTFFLDYKNIQGGPQYELSSGGQYSMHGDFFAAWDSRAQNALVASCLNGPQNCTSIKRSGDTLIKKGVSIQLASFKASPQVLVLGAQTTPAASALPTTGPERNVLAGTLGLTAAFYGLMLYRTRRRGLRLALLSSGPPR